VTFPHAGQGKSCVPRCGKITDVNAYGDYPGGEAFEPWQDHEWPEHCGVPATYLGEIGNGELAMLAGGDAEAFLQEHEVFAVDPPITLDMVPPHAPREGETWESTIHHFRCTDCGWDLFLWDAS
jgi:uncharacterized protein CbrC (UPF0167 family)